MEFLSTITKKDGKITNNQGKNIFEDIDLIPPYSIDFLRPKNLNSVDLAMVNTCRGPCVYNCIHCLGSNVCYSLSPRSKIIFHSTSWVVEQIQQLLDLGLKRIGIQDYCYSNPQFISDLAKAIQKENLRDAGLTLERAFEQIAQHGKPEQRPEHRQHLRQTLQVDGRGREEMQQQRIDRDGQTRADRTFPGFTRADTGRQFVLAEAASGEIRRGIGDHDDTDHNQQQIRADIAQCDQAELDGDQHDDAKQQMQRRRTNGHRT